MIKIKILTEDQIDQYLVGLLGKLNKRKKIVLALPTGNTPVSFYKKLGASPKLNWSKIIIFMLDVYYPQNPDDPLSFSTYIKTNLLNLISLPTENFHILKSNTSTPEKECERYEELVYKAGGLDLVILGLGENGHIAFNEPGTSIDSLTHLSKLQNSSPELPDHALTMGIKTILKSKKIILVAKGKSKANAVLAALRGPVSSKCPASFLQTHKDTTFLIDHETAGLLNGNALG